VKKPLLVSMLLSASLTVLAPTSAPAFGAIAVDDNKAARGSAFAIVVNQDSAYKAAHAAVGRCRSNGGKNCRVVANFEKCGAFATSATAYGAGTGVRRKSARNMALRNCGDDCEIVGVECEGE